MSKDCINTPTQSSTSSNTNPKFCKAIWNIQVPQNSKYSYGKLAIMLFQLKQTCLEKKVEVRSYLRTPYAPFVTQSLRHQSMPYYYVHGLNQSSLVKISYKLAENPLCPICNSEPQTLKYAILPYRWIKLVQFGYK